jgi:starch synthase (maltosyl-transferring)
VIGRIVVDDLRPRTPEGFPAKAVVGEAVRISADVFKDGHDVLAGQVRWRPKAKGNGKWLTAPLHHAGNDRWEAVVEPTTLGLHEFVVEAWTDRYATWHHKVTAKQAAGQDVTVELLEGEGLEADDGPGDDVTTSPPMPLWVDRERALVGAWYELFPRSFGGLAGVRDHLPHVAELGFDVLYLPPIHPIGRGYRKGPNNTLTATPDDPGSPWAIGSEEGGHTAIHPDLGTFTDFEALVERAHELGMEIALDYALQCSPDHPWVKEHPEWFHRRPDGSIAYAENPPKKYQDIYPINFWPAAEADRTALWDACKEIVDFWIGKGVRIFRVDNPHTKPVAFWAWMIPAVQAEHPDVLFLAEAFTKPKMMAKLAEVGFSQSYTYFTWRTAAWELQEYLDELAHGPKADFMRPNFWPNTPDILAGPLRGGPPAAFRQRLVLAATLVPSYGIYSGYELCENEPMSDANEEYLRSEKYEVKDRDWDSPRSLAPFVAQVNDIRRRHPALHRLRNIRFHHSANEQVLAYSKHTDDRSDVVLVVVNLDPQNTQEATLGLDLGYLGLPWDMPFEAYDELSGQSFRWQGAEPYVRLDPHQAAHILHLRTRAT